MLDGLNIRHYFDAIVSADDVLRSKPDPETYLSCAKLVEVDPTNCIVFEDAPKGVECALNAGMQAVVITSMHRADEFQQYSNVRCSIKDYRLADTSILFNS